jgi:ribosomal protein S17E
MDGLAKDMRLEVRKTPSIVNKYRRGRNKEEEIRAAYTNWIEQQTWRTMEVAQSSRLSINSMGIGPIVSSVIFTMMQGVTSAAPTIPGTDFKLIPETVTSAVSVMFNAPTEMISFTGAILGANNLGLERFPWLMSNDEQKNLQIMAKIFEKSSKQHENIIGGGQGHLEEITDAELHKIYNPILRTMGIGRFFVRKGIWLWKKWDQFKQRNEYKKKESGALSEHNPNSMWNCRNVC